MKSSTKVTWAALVALAVQHVYAQQDSSLFIPGLQPQDFTVQAVGTGADGLTTYKVEAPSLQEIGGQGVVFTLVEGSATAGYTAVASAANPTATLVQTIAVACDIPAADGNLPLANCDETLVVISGGSTSIASTLVTFAVGGIPVQVVTSSSGSTSSTTTSPTSISTTSTSTTSTSTSTSTKSSTTPTNTAPAATPSTTQSAASVQGVSGSLLALMVGISTLGYLLL
ncbi:hypothetical protein M422DRAFT_36978 [Sphaerobolus stellatus SS14]|uniref:Uncharacterized protein n=1 Tax=Sphaerobolus stellatus (strain SS14) TaxID=990650 RepID=A0A0C9UVI4_SPHS4|nr:hypothetical protein M422DRAFT_36978 [Sphaerobolus stellatus SS14]